MFRRLPTFMPLAFATTVGLFALTSVLTAQPTPAAQPTTTAPGDSGVKRTQEENLKYFQRFRDEVLKLAQRWEKATTTTTRNVHKSLRAALKLIEEKGIEKLFKDLVEGVGSKNITQSDFNTLLGKDKKLMDALEQILNVLNTEDEAARRRIEIENLKKAIAAIQELKRAQENLRARTDNPKGDPNKLAKDQKDLAAKTDATAKALDKNNPDAKGNPNAGGEKQDPKSENKAEAKPGDNTGENKPETKENKAGDKADGMGMPMSGDPKRRRTAKPGAPMAGMPTRWRRPAPRKGWSRRTVAMPNLRSEPKPNDPG